MNKIIFIDTEVGLNDEKILDFGAVKEDGSEFYGKYTEAFANFLRGKIIFVGTIF